MRFQYLLHVAAGGALCAPALLQQSQDPQVDALQSALVRTDNSIRVLEGVQADLAAGDVSAIRQLRSLTEAPAETPRTSQEERLDALMREVALLDEELNRRELAARQEAEAEVLQPEQTTGSPLTTIGLSSAERRLLNERKRPMAEFAAAGRKVFEDEGYVADSLRLGKAYFKANDFAAAERELARLDVVPEATYWRARALEKLGQAEAALATYQITQTLEPGSLWARNAERDATFLKWQVDFEKSLQSK